MPTRARPRRRKLRGGEGEGEGGKIEPVQGITGNTLMKVNASRDAAQKFVGKPEVTFPFLMCFILFITTALVYASDDGEEKDGETHKSFTTYMITLSMMAMNIAAALSFAIFQKNLEDVHLYGFFGMAVVSFLFWIFLVYEASQLVP